MNYRYIENSGLRVSEIGLGSIIFGKNANFKIMDKVERLAMLEHQTTQLMD